MLKKVLGALHGVGASLVQPADSSRPEGPKEAGNPFADPRWAMVRDKPPAEWDLDAMYATCCPKADRPFVAIASPQYRESAHIARVCANSRNAVRADLEKHGIASGFVALNGDSLICRMRQRAVHLFLMSGASHLLFWDGDIECMTPTCVREMLATGHDVIAGACPFKDSTGRTVHNLWDEDEGKPLEVVNGCVEVRDAGTGFMLISRAACLKLMQAHPELLHWSMSMASDRGAPLWAIFDTGVVDGVYQSEDYMFCALWQQLGGKVYVYAPAEFAHWGEHGFRASFTEQHGLGLAKEL